MMASPDAHASAAFSFGPQNNHTHTQKKMFYKKSVPLMCAKAKPWQVVCLWKSESPIHWHFLLLCYDASLLGPSEPCTLPLPSMCGLHVSGSILIRLL